MSFQLPVLSDDQQFERLIRDILRRNYNDKGVERFGRSGQSQFGIDGIIPSAPEIVFQCKLKDVRFRDDKKLSDELLSELEEELENTKDLTRKPERFIFASTFKNDTKLQEKAFLLSNESLTVEYWGRGYDQRKNLALCRRIDSGLLSSVSGQTSFGFQTDNSQTDRGISGYQTRRIKSFRG